MRSLDDLHFLCTAAACCERVPTSVGLAATSRSARKRAFSYSPSDRLLCVLWMRNCSMLLVCCCPPAWREARQGGLAWL